MPLPVSKGTINTGVNADSYAFGAFTPTRDAALVVSVDINGTNPVAAISDDQGGALVWTLQQDNTGATNSIRTWTAVAPASPASTIITISFTGATGAIGEVLEIPGGVYRQSGTQAGAAAAAPNVTLGSAILAASAAIGFVYNTTSPPALTPPANWTESQDIGHAAPATGMETAFIAAGETGSTITWGSTTATAWRAHLLEFAVHDLFAQAVM